MSWFDTSGLASLAKNALKEAQKQIDKALDIQDEEMSTPVPDYKSKTEPTTPMQPIWPSSNTFMWGSFTGSFFENPKADEMVTTPPRSGTTPTPGDHSAMKRQSVHSNSDSVEVLSPPTTPCSGVTSPSVTVYHSESVEVITTPTSSELLSPDSAKSPDSVEVIPNDEIIEEDDDSMSFNTVMDDCMDQSVVTEAPTKAGSLSSDLPNSSVMDSCESVKTVVESTGSGTSRTSICLLNDDTLADSQTLLSDSTQSFEDVQIPDMGSDDKDMVKIRSGPPSEQTSADEVDTTTSSDIEIISNPYGDSSSTNSACRSSPLKMNIPGGKNGCSKDFKNVKKGHCREPSEISTHSDDSQQSSHSETEKLLRRINELNEILDSREMGLLEMCRQNCVLQEKNAEYQIMLEAKQKRTDHLEAEEYTQRLSALEKKFQMSIRERDALRDQLKAARDELNTKIPKENLDKIVSEKNFMIDELRTEGEKLSKQILQHSNIIKKLRVKEKENESQLKKNKEQIEELSEEVERLKKSLAAKEEVERSQIEAVHKLSWDKRKLENENHSMKSQIEDLMSKLDTMKTSMDATRKELQEKQNTHTELTRKAQALAALESEKEQTQSQNVEILRQLEDLREKLRAAEYASSVREQKLRQENGELLRKLEIADLRADELAQETSLAAIPLVKQLNALQSTLACRTSNWEKQEQKLVRELEETQRKLSALEKIDIAANEQKSVLNSRIKNMEDRLSSALLKAEQLTNLLQQQELEFSLKENEYKRQQEKLQNKLDETLREMNDINSALTKKVEAEKSGQSSFTVAEASIKEPSADATNTLEVVEDNNEMRTGNTSPTLSLGRNSLADSLGSSAWQMDDLDCISNSGRQIGMCGSVYGLSTNMGHTASMIENLQSTLKQKDGEVSQLQWELSRLQSERNALNNELSNLSSESENIREKLVQLETMQKEFVELQRQYDALLQMYGEKVEETQELELDLQDVKEMYKAQIDELLRQKQIP